MNPYIWEKILLMQLPLWHPWCKSEECGMKGRIYWQSIAGDARVVMWLKEDHGHDTGAARRKKNHCSTWAECQEKGKLVAERLCVYSVQQILLCLYKADGTLIKGSVNFPKTSLWFSVFSMFMYLLLQINRLSNTLPFFNKDALELLLHKWKANQAPPVWC